MSGDPKQNGIIFWKAGPLQYRLPPLGKCLRNGLNQCRWHCERLPSALMICFWRLFQCVCAFLDGWFTSAPAHTTLSVQQCLTKNGMTPMAPPPYSPDLAQSNSFLFPWIKKCPQRVTFCLCERGETTNSRNTIRHQNWWVQNLFWAVEKNASNGEYIGGDWNLNMYE